MSALLHLLIISVALAAPVQLRAPDGLTLHAEHTAVTHPRGAVLLLHAPGQNRHEFRGIVGRLAREGYASLALDQRSGGRYDGHNNPTVAGLGTRILTERSALSDLDVAWRWLKRTYPNASVFALGSGASGTLLIPFAAQRPELAGVLAFSPYRGDLFETDALAAARRMHVPLFVTSSDDPFEVQAARELLNATASACKRQYVPPGFGLRGAVNLDPAKTTEPVVTERYWTAVLSFMEAAKSRKRRC
ncbi:alpha/beta hydrolase [Deinococcus deserti]|nr:alpha/beta hydrolase [Deinococcus deserti]